MPRLSLLVVCGALAFAAGCGHVLPKEARERADADLTFEQVFRDPEAQLGRTLLLGGLILGHTPGPETTTLELLAYRLDRRGEPVAIDASGGRFLARACGFLDPAVYAPGLLVTLSATVEGREIRPLLGTHYPYPVLAIDALHLWEEPFRRGIYGHPNPYAPFYVRPPQDEGHENPYDPSFAPYPYTPTWHR